MTDEANSGPMPDEMEAKARPWWHSIPKDDFRSRIQSMSVTELESLATQISGEAANLSHHLQAGSPDADWVARAKRALGNIVGRKKIVQAQLQLHNAGRQAANYRRREKFIGDARERLDAGDVSGAVRLILDWMDIRAEQAKP